MPLLGKIVVIKRNGGDGTEFPLTASCLFGRKLDCDIRIQLPQVSKEHCKIELNENKELILTNLSSVNPTRINGQVFDQSERLKHGDLITIIDRSFRFEYPPPRTPKKRLSGKAKTVQALQEQQGKSTPVPVEKRKSENSFDTCLKDGSNLPPAAEQTAEVEPEDAKLKKDSMSPFCELYQMVKQDLVAKSPWKSELPKTPLARSQHCEEVPTSTKKRRSSKSSSEDAAKSTTTQTSCNANLEDVSSADVKSTPKRVTTPSTKKRRSSKYGSEDIAEPATPLSSVHAALDEKTANDMQSVGSSTPSLTEKTTTPVSQKRTPLKTPQKFSAGEVVQQILLEPQPEKTPKSPKRRSGESQNQNQPQTPGTNVKSNEVKMSPRTSPRSNAGKRFQVQDVVHEDKAMTSASKKNADTLINEQRGGLESHTEVAVTKPRRKRVSFGGQLSPELFDKRLPPNSPLRRGATPRRSLGPSQKSQSLLRRASTIGLLALRLEETAREAQKSSKTASPKRAAAKTPSPAKRTPIAKVKTPSPKRQKSPSAAAKVSAPSTPATPKTPGSARRASTSAIEAVIDSSSTETPKMQGRFSVSRICTPSPVQGEEAEVQSVIVEDLPQKYETPKIPLKRKSMKSSGRKTPKSAVKSAHDVMRSRRSGASRANLKVLTSWADIVKFGQIKPQIEVATKKKPTKKTVVRKTVAPKPKTPVRRLKDEISTGHAASPVTIVVGKAHMRTNQFVGAAPKIVSNIAVCKKDMKMDEDFTGVADIFKTPANSKSKNIVLMTNECPEVLPDEISVMKTPEESGEMIVSPLSVVSTAKGGRYNNEAVTRLLLDNQDGSLLEDESLVNNPNETSDKDIISDQEMPSLDQTDEEEPTPEMVVETPKQKAAPLSCLTGVKRLMKTPKQRAEPIEDLRGKLLKTPKECKPSQEESLEGIKQLLKTPKQKSNPVLCAAGLKRLMRTPQEKFEHQEDLTGVKELMKTPKLKGELVEKKFGLKRLVKTPRQKKIQAEEDLTDVKQLMKTPKHKGEPVEDQMGVKRLMQTPKEKAEHVEDLTGLKQLMQTPKQNPEPVSSPLGTSKLMKTPQVKEAMAEDDITEPKMLEEPENSTLTTGEILEPVPVVDSDSALTPAEDFNKECDKENICPVETMEVEVLKSVDHKCFDEAVDSNHGDPEIEDNITEEKQLEKQSASVEFLGDCSFSKDDKTKEQSEEVCNLNDTSTTVEANPSLPTDKEDISPVKTMEIEDLKLVDHKCTGETVYSNLSDPEVEDKITEEKHQVLTTEESASVEVVDDCSSSKDEKTKEQSEEACTLDNTSTTVEANPEQEDEEPIKSSLSNKSQRGSRGRAAQKPKNELAKPPAVLSIIQEDKMTVQQPLSPARGRRGRKALEVPEVAASPVRKSARGRILKNSIEDEQTKSNEACQVAEDSLKKESDCLPVVPKTRKGRKVAGDPHCSDVPTTEEPVQAPVVRSGRRKINKTESKPSADDAEAPIEPILDVNAGSLVEEVVQAPALKAGRRKKMDKTESMPSADHADGAVEPIPDGSAAEEVVRAPTVKPGRRKKIDKTERQPSSELEEETPEIVCEENAVVPEVAKCQTSQGTTRARRGRQAKKENLETEPAQILESEISDTPAVVVDEKPITSAAKSGRGRKAKQETVKDQPLDEDVQTVTKANTDHEEPENPVVKSGRGRKAKQQKPQLVEEVVDQPAVDTSLHLPVEEEQTEVLLKSVRGGRKAKQAKVVVSVEAEENHEPTETPLKPGRKRTVSAKVTEIDAEVPVKRGRRAVADPVPPVAVLPSRGRKAVVKAQSEVTEDVASSEEPVKAVKNTRRTAKEPASKKEQSPVTQADSETVAERGSGGKKTKDSSPVNASEEASETKSSKTVNWNPDLVASKDIEEFEPAADVSKPQLKKSRRLGKSSAETSSTESTELPPRGRRGRGAAKKEEELPVEDSQTEAEMKVKTVRRGKAVAASAPKSEPSESKAPTPLKRKRNEVLEVTDESVTKEPLPKRRGRVANSADVAKEVSSKEKIPEAEQEKAEANPKTNNRTARGQKKTAPEPDPAPAPQPVSGTGTRRGRGVKKVEEVEVSTEVAPVRRTRRK